MSRRQRNTNHCEGKRRRRKKKKVMIMNNGMIVADDLMNAAGNSNFKAQT